MNCECVECNTHVDFYTFHRAHSVWVDKEGDENSLQNSYTAVLKGDYRHHTASRACRFVHGRAWYCVDVQKATFGSVSVGHVRRTWCFHNTCDTMYLVTAPVDNEWNNETDSESDKHPGDHQPPRPAHDFFCQTAGVVCSESLS